MNETTKKTAYQPADDDVALRPPVDTFEDADGITLIADMPGVDRDGLSLHVDKDTLTVAGEANIGTIEGMQTLYADIHGTRYERSFSLSSELDPERIEASLKDGVLNVRIPKRAEVRPRKIEVRAG